MHRLISHIEDVNTENVEPLYSPLGMVGEKLFERKDDDSGNNLAEESESILQSAPEKMRRFYVTPQVKE